MFSFDLFHFCTMEDEEEEEESRQLDLSEVKRKKSIFFTNVISTNPVRPQS